MESRFRISIASPPDRDSLVAEVFFEAVQWAELREEWGKIVVEFYPRPDGEPWLVDFEVTIQALNEANDRLLGALN